MKRLQRRGEGGIEFTGTIPITCELLQGMEMQAFLPQIFAQMDGEQLVIKKEYSNIVSTVTARKSNVSIER